MKYYWIKLRMDFFGSPEIKWLLKQTNGPSYVIIYQQLCMEAAKNGTDTLVARVANFCEPYTPEDLSRMTGFPIDTVRAGLVFLANAQLIQIGMDGSIKIPKALKMVGVDKLKAGTSKDDAKKAHVRELNRLRKRRQRARERMLKEGGGTQAVQISGKGYSKLLSGAGINPNSSLADLAGKKPEDLGFF